MTTECITKMNEAIKKNRRVLAIKILKEETQCSLKVAKEAIEKRYDQSSHGLDIVPSIYITSISIDYGEGEVKMSLNDFHMMNLINIDKIGVDECRRLIDLHDKIIEWQKLSFID